jgi:DNA-binding transcriptional MocR family regulator
VVLTTLTRPGDVVLTEPLTYTGIKAIASLLHLQLQPLAADDDGVTPDALDAACRTGRPRALYCMPTLQNPTGRTMPTARRRELVEVVLKYGLALVEDDVYGFLPRSPLPPLAALAPTLAYYVTSTSKSLVPGLRVGYVVAPTAKVERVAGIIRASTWLTSPLLAELATLWIEDGGADELVAWKRAETAERQALARRVLAPWLTPPPTDGINFWLPLPEPWRTEEFVTRARNHGVIVSPSDEFVVGRESAPHAVRISLGPGGGRARLEAGLERLAAILRDGPGPSPMVY